MEKNQKSKTAKSDGAQSTRVLVGDGSKFKSKPDSAQLAQRPMQLTAWTQTTAADFGNLTQVEMSMPSKRESELLDKIRILEDSLREHSQLLSQINVTSMRTSAILEHSKPKNQNKVGISTPSTGNVVGVIVSSDSIQQPEPQISNSANPGLKYAVIAKTERSPQIRPLNIKIKSDPNISTVSENYNLNKKSENYSNVSETQNHDYSVNEQYILQTANNYYENKISLPSSPTNRKRKLPKPKKQYPPPEIDANFVPAFYNYANFKIGDTQLTEDDLKDLVSIGPNNTLIPVKIFDSIKWTTSAAATRKLLMVIFGREVLATHSMTGRPSPAFKDQKKPTKKMLNPLVIQDIIFAVTRKCNVSEKEVRTSITTKCADENKMVKLKEIKMAAMKELNKENVIIIPPKKKYLKANFNADF